METLLLCVIGRNQSSQALHMCHFALQLHQVFCFSATLLPFLFAQDSSHAISSLAVKATFPFLAISQEEAFLISKGTK
jgi:hypothetical protein